MNKKKLCLLSYDLRSGGAERVISQWSTLLKDDFDVYMTTFQRECIYPYSGKYVCLEVNDDYSSSLSKIRNVWRRAAALKNFVKKEKIDIVLSFCNECNLANTVSTHSAIKICSIRGTSDLYANPFVKYVVLSRRNNLIIQTNELKSIMINKYGQRIASKIFVYGNPFDTETIQKLAEENPSDEITNLLKRGRTLVNVGSFKKLKNHAHLLKSFELVAEHYSDVQLMLVGANIGLQPIIQEMASKSAFADRIHFVGEVKNPFAIERRSTLFVFPSLTEGMPNALAEAMVSGMPVVSANCLTGPAELLSEKPNNIVYNKKGYCVADYGILVQPFSEYGDCDYNSTNEEDRRFADAILYALESEAHLNELKLKSQNGTLRFNINEYKSGLISLINNIAYGG